PGELRGDLLALARRGDEVHAEAAVGEFEDSPFHPAQMIEIDDDLFAHAAGNRRDDQRIAGLHFDDLAGKLAAVDQHVAAQDRYAHTLEASFVLGGGRGTRMGPTHRIFDEYMPRPPLIAAGIAPTICVIALTDGKAGG